MAIKKSQSAKACSAPDELPGKKNQPVATPPAHDTALIADVRQRIDGARRRVARQLQERMSGIHVAEYLTVLPPREALQARLHQAIATAPPRLLGGVDS